MINKLQFFGCSFTEAETSLTGHEFESHRNLITKNTGIPHISHAVTGKSNQHIINDVYLASKKDLNNHSIYVIQYTFFNRLGMYSDMNEDRFISMCRTDLNENDIDDKPIIEFYRQWLKYFYSRKTTVLEFEKQVDFISNWLHYRNIPFISFGYDFDMNLFSKSFYNRNNFIQFEDTYSLYQKMVEKKLRITDLGPIEKFNDNHLNKEGHQYLATYLTTKINTY